MVACKYEEVSVPPISQYIEAMDGAYEKEEMLQMERNILKAVGFHVSTPTAYTFYSRIESLVEYPALSHRPSLLTSASYYLSKRLRSRPIPWPPILQRQFGYSESDLKPCLRLLYLAYISSERSVLQATRKKFSSPAFSEVSKLRL
jgi:hypothetical protein